MLFLGFSLSLRLLFYHVPIRFLSTQVILFLERCAFYFAIFVYPLCFKAPSILFLSVLYVYPYY